MDNGILQLAFNVFNNRGVYALLLGSGISQAAEIPTGWNIIGDLIRQIAYIRGLEIHDPYEWYRDEVGKEPQYDVLLEELSPTRAERNASLRPYFEPNEDERERGAKLPTPAHRAIASLVQNGFIKVIVTTNFDRLLETALQEIGIVPDVLNTDDMVIGRTPLRHSPITILKLHGDYTDWRSLNTTDELGSYSENKNQLLDEIFDEYGLIICGWSAIWDVALRNALYRSRSRRYTTYWAVHGNIAQEAQDLIDNRHAQSINISSANDFFTELDQIASALSQFRRTDPLSIAVTVERVKKFLREANLIGLDDLIHNVMRQGFQASSEEEIIHHIKSVSEGAKPVDVFETIPPLYFQAAERLIHTITALSWYGTDSEANYTTEAINQWTDNYEDLSRTHGGIWGVLPIWYLIYASGIAAVYRENWSYIQAILIEPRLKLTYHQHANSFIVRVGEEILLAIVRSRSGNPTWLSKHLESQLRPVFQNYISTNVAYTNAFDLFETLLALVYLTNAPENRDWMPPHTAYQSGRSWNYLEDFWLKAGKQDSNWKLLRKTNLLPSDFQQRETLLTTYQQLVVKFQKGTMTFPIGVPDYASIYKRGTGRP